MTNGRTEILKVPTPKIRNGWFEDNAHSIGCAPLVQLNRIHEGAPAIILAKIEGRNPAYSVKCRIGAAMVWDAERCGLLGSGNELVEPTSGNTGIAPAFVAAAGGYPRDLFWPRTSRRHPESLCDRIEGERAEARC